MNNARIRKLWASKLNWKGKSHNTKWTQGVKITGQLRSSQERYQLATSQLREMKHKNNLSTKPKS